MHLVFSYGTLKRGQPNHHHMAAGIESGDCELVGFGVTLTRYPLIVDQLFNIPFLLDVTDNLNAVVSTRNSDEVIGENTTVILTSRYVIQPKIILLKSKKKNIYIYK